MCSPPTFLNKFEPKIQNRPLLVCAKSIFTLILKFPDKFIENEGRVGFLVNDTWAKFGFEIWPF